MTARGTAKMATMPTAGQVVSFGHTPAPAKQYATAAATAIAGDLARRPPTTGQLWPRAS